MREVLLIAGEVSGETHGAGVARELATIAPELGMIGIGGDRMEGAGVELIEHVRSLAVMGFISILKHIPQHWRLLRRIDRMFASGRIAVVVLIDYPGLNLRIAELARKRGIPVLYYIAPQVWAWGAGRLPKMANVITKAAVILPFEAELLRSHGIDATYVGHPLLDRAGSLPTRDDARQALGLDPARPVLALFPGSRRQELARHVAPFVATARELERRVPGLQVVVSAAPNVEIDEGECPYPVVAEASFAILRAADVAMCKSGTTTLEAAMCGCPLVLAYRTSRVEYEAAKRLMRIPHIGLVNIVAGKGIVPEFIQSALQPAVVADRLASLIDRGSPDRRQMLDDLSMVRARLGEPGASSRVARMIVELANAGRSESGVV